MISIITPVWNRSDLTAKYLLAHSMIYQNPQDIEWIIVDNGSTDGTEGILDYWQGIMGKPLKVLTNKENKGFSIACNQGARKARGNVLVFLNNDVNIIGDYITIIERTLIDKQIIGPQLITTDTGWNVFDSQVISYIAGWCMTMTRSTYEYLGGFDERYSPADYEDMDLCYNALKQDFSLQAVRMPLQHLGEQTGNLLPDRRKITETNRVKFAEKWGLRL